MALECSHTTTVVLKRGTRVVTCRPSPGDRAEPSGQDKGRLLPGARLPHDTRHLPLPGAEGEAGPAQWAEDGGPAPDPGVRGRGHHQTGPQEAPLCRELLQLPLSG